MDDPKHVDQDADGMVDGAGIEVDERAAASDLTEGPLWGHIRRLAVPAATGLFFNVLFNITDTFCAGLWSTDAQAGLAFSFPLFFLILAVAVGLLQGSSGLQARSKGAGKIREGRYFLGQTLILIVVGGALLGAFGLLVARQLFEFLGATSHQQELGYSYVRWIYLGAPMMIASLVSSGLLSAYGNTRTFRNALVTTAILNLLLDPMLMFGWFGLPELGMDGIGIATFLAFTIQVAIMAPALLRLPIFDGLTLKYLVPRWIGMRRCLAQASPPSLNMMAIGAGFFVNTYFIGHIDTLAVAAYGIALRIEQIVLLPAHGINIALLAIAGQNFGARRFERLHESYRSSVKAGLALAGIGAVIMVGFGWLLMSLFNDDPAVVRYGYQYLLVATLIGPMYTFLHIDNSTLQALGRPQLIGWFGLLRHGVLPLVLCTLFVSVLDYGILGVWGSLMLANLLTTALLHLHLRTTIRARAPLPAPG